MTTTCPSFALNPAYKRLLVKDSNDKDTRNYVKERYKKRHPADQEHRAAQADHHEGLLLDCGPSAGFLEKGIDQLKPMMIKEVAEEIGVHPSTVSRAVASKYAAYAARRVRIAVFSSPRVCRAPRGATRRYSFSSAA